MLTLQDEERYACLIERIPCREYAVRHSDILSDIGHGVDYHLDLTPEGRIFPLRIDPCLNAPLSRIGGETGVLDMAFLSIIRRWHKREHVPIREISRRLGVSWNTIRKCLRSDQIELKFQVPDRPSKLDPYAETLATWLR